MSRDSAGVMARGKSINKPFLSIAGPLMAGYLSLLAGCGSAPPADPVDLTPPPIERFVGALPCSDCRIIRADLTLHRDPASGQPTAFYLQEAHVDAIGGDFVTTHWGEFRANTSDSVTYLRLERDDPLTLRMEEGGDTLEWVGKQGVDSDYQFTRAEPLG